MPGDAAAPSSVGSAELETHSAMEAEAIAETPPMQNDMLPATVVASFDMDSFFFAAFATVVIMGVITRLLWPAAKAMFRAFDDKGKGGTD